METINIQSKEYPEILRKIQNPPRKLYIQGNINNLKNKCIAIIGSRNCTEKGIILAKRFAKELSTYDVTIVSGMAKGIDTASHIGALEAGGKTIAVLPSGFGNIYPKENIKLYKQIIKNNGTAVTEYEYNKKACSQYFIERNRIVCGLSMATLVIEAAYRSGTSITARLTEKQGKTVYCLPRCNRLYAISRNKQINKKRGKTCYKYTRHSKRFPIS